MTWGRALLLEAASAIHVMADRHSSICLYGDARALYPHPAAVDVERVKGFALMPVAIKLNNRVGEKSSSGGSGIWELEQSCSKGY